MAESAALTLILFLTFISLKWGVLVFLPIVVAFFIYSLFIPSVERMMSFSKLSKQLSSLAVMLIFLSLSASLFWPLITGLKSFIRDLTEYQGIVVSVKAKVLEQLGQLGYEISPKAVMDFAEGLPIGSVLQSTTGVISQLTAIGFLVFLYLTFMFLEPGKIHESSFLGQVSALVRRFFWTKSLVSAMSAALIGIFLAVLGVPYALMFSVLTFILSFVPAVGQFIASLLPLPLVYLNFVHGDSGSWIFMLFVFLVPNFIQSFFENLVWPRLLKDTLGLHPITILACLVFWSLIWGVIGTFFAIPLTAVLRLVFERFPSTQNLAMILKGKLTHQ